MRQALEKENRGAHAKTLALFQLQRLFLLVRPAENECVLWTFTALLKVSRGFAELKGPLLTCASSVSGY